MTTYWKGRERGLSPEDVGLALVPGGADGHRAFAVVALHDAERGDLGLRPGCRVKSSSE